MGSWTTISIFRAALSSRAESIFRDMRLIMSLRKMRGHIGRRRQERKNGGDNEKLGSFRQRSAAAAAAAQLCTLAVIQSGILDMDGGIS